MILFFVNILSEISFPQSGHTINAITFPYFEKTATHSWAGSTRANPMNTAESMVKTIA